MVPAGWVDHCGQCVGSVSAVLPIPEKWTAIQRMIPPFACALGLLWMIDGWDRIHWGCWGQFIKGLRLYFCHTIAPPPPPPPEYYGISYSESLPSSASASILLPGW